MKKLDNRKVNLEKPSSGKVSLKELSKLFSLFAIANQYSKISWSIFTEIE